MAAAGIGGCALPEADMPPLATGDLLFMVTPPEGMGRAIAAATGSDDALPDFTHVGIAVLCERADRELLPAADSVLEATSEGGVQMVALHTWLGRAATRNGRPAVQAMRLRDTTGVAASVARAREHLGKPYDFWFLPDNDCFYCSELVWASYLTDDGLPRFQARPMNFRAADGSMPPYWTELFARLGEPIPEGVPGTNPNDLARDPQLRLVGRWF